MASAEKFCLRWNDFESNISVAFRELREEKDFFDVTLACEDSQVSAHKVILSACSPFFRNVLRKNPHQHPLLYLKGVKYQEMLSVLNFMYQGEVNVAQEELNSFLAVAEELRVKGLTQNTQESGKQRDTAAAPRDPVPPPKRPRPAPPPIAAAPRQPAFGQHPQQRKEESEVQEIEEVQTVKAEPREQQSYLQENQSYAGNQESAVALEDGYQEEYGDYAQYEGQYDAIDPNTGLPIADGNKGEQIIFHHSTLPPHCSSFVAKPADVCFLVITSKHIVLTMLTMLTLLTMSITSKRPRYRSCNPVDDGCTGRWSVEVHSVPACHQVRQLVQSH